MKLLPALFLTVLLTNPNAGAETPVSAGAGAADSSPAFAFISPAVAAGLESEAGTLVAQDIIKRAEHNLTKSPSPMPKVHTEGTLPHKGIRDQSIQAEGDWKLMLDFALAYRLTGDSRFLSTTEKFMSAWAGVYQLSFNPIDETSLDQMIFAYDLTNAALTPATRDKMRDFLRNMSQGYLDKMAHGKKDNANWQSHRIKLAVLAAYAVGDPQLIAQARQTFQQQVSANIKADGSVVDFYKRDALHYVVYDLEPLTTAAVAAKAHGEDWFHASVSGGSSIEKAMDWLTPFTLGQKQHEEFVHSKVAFDAARAKVGLKGYSGMWEPASSIKLYQLASLADPKYAGILKQIPSSEEHLQDWLVLLAKP